MLGLLLWLPDQCELGGKPALPAGASLLPFTLSLAMARFVGFTGIVTLFLDYCHGLVQVAGRWIPFFAGLLRCLDLVGVTDIWWDALLSFA